MSTQITIENRVIIDSTPTSGSVNAVSSGGVFTALGTKEPTIASGTTAQYWRGDKSWQPFPFLGLAIGTTPMTSGTVGRLIFQGAGDVVQQDSNLFWDNTNKRLGIGATPNSSTLLDLRAQGALSTDIAFRIRNSANTVNILSFSGNGQFAIGFGATTGGDRAVSIGSYAQAMSSFATVIGAFASAGALSDASVSLGYNSSISNTGYRGIALGFLSIISGDRGIALGETSNVTSTKGIAIGSLSSVTANNSTLIGSNATNSIANSNAFSNGLNGFSFFNDINSNYVINSAVVPINNISYLNTTKNVIYLGTAVKPTSTIKNGIQSYTGYRTISQASSTVGATATGVANLKTLTFSAGTNMSALTVGTRIIVTNGTGEQTHANIVSVSGLVVTIDTALVNISALTLNATSTSVINSSIVIISDFHQELRNDKGDIIKLYKQTLPAVPVLTDVIAVLTNLGLI
jgi:hypothetical protein